MPPNSRRFLLLIALVQAAELFSSIASQTSVLPLFAWSLGATAQ